MIFAFISSLIMAAVGIFNFKAGSFLAFGISLFFAGYCAAMGVALLIDKVVRREK